MTESLKTSLTASQLGEIFRQSMRSSWWSEFRGAGTTFSEVPSDAFSQLDEDPPTHTIRATLGGGGLEIQGSGVDMYIWERDSGRVVKLTRWRHYGAFGVKADRRIGRFLEMVKEADAEAG